MTKNRKNAAHEGTCSEHCPVCLFNDWADLTHRLLQAINNEIFVDGGARMEELDAHLEKSRDMLRVPCMEYNESTDNQEELRQ